MAAKLLGRSNTTKRLEGGKCGVQLFLSVGVVVVVVSGSAIQNGTFT